MIFTQFEFYGFLVIVVAGYWGLRRRGLQNLWLLAASYFFYGFVHPWFCMLLATSTLVDYSVARGIAARVAPPRLLLSLSVAVNLGILGTFKYFDFFATNVRDLLAVLGWGAGEWTLGLLLPVGISFYTFQTLGYTIDVYRGRVTARTNLADFALYVAFFPQLVAGPIERATRLLPQIEGARRWDWGAAQRGAELIIWGLFKKLAIADNVAFYVDGVFGLPAPGLWLLLAGSGAFALQIYADFSAYTDIARGSARLLGFELMENFRFPYRAVSPSDFWRRWHISLSSWMRDYLYIPLGGNRGARARALLALATTFILSGLWHGAAWNFVFWGAFHLVLLLAYRQLGMGGRWEPRGIGGSVLAAVIMVGFNLVGWSLFRAPSTTWWFGAWSPSVDALTLAASQLVAVYTLAYAAPMAIKPALDGLVEDWPWLRGAMYGTTILLTALLWDSGQGQDFVYFRF